jgi:hypothetical protein
MTLPVAFAIIVGMGMLAQWSISYFTKQIPELESEPYRIWFHIAGEIITAVLLITGGIALLAKWPSAQALYLLAMGMLIYTAIESPGYFAQKGQWAWVLIFAVIVILAILSAITVASSTATY